MTRNIRQPATVRIGISGWRYAGWRGVFYPSKLAQRRELEFAANTFPTVEINGTFYSLQRPELPPLAQRSPAACAASPAWPRPVRPLASS